MGYEYIVIFGTGAEDTSPVLDEGQLAFLADRGLSRVYSERSLLIFASAQTPVGQVAGGVTIGHVFERESTSTCSSRLGQGKPGAVGGQMLSACWGEYVLIEAGCAPAATFHVMRDPSGGLPCLYSWTDQARFLSSDALLAEGLGLYEARIDWHFITQALAHPHLNTERTGLDGIQELLPGCCMTLSRRGVDVQSAWSPWDFVREPARFEDPRSAASEIRAAVTTVVRTWARTDRKILMELSGGLDSSIVAMCLRGTGADIACCTMVTPVPGADERRYARQVADALGVGLEVELLGFENARFDFPLPAPSVRPRMTALQHVAFEAVRAAARKHGSSSFFSGGGGDTVFSYLPGAVPAADAFLQRGLRSAISAIGDLSALHQCTHWRAARLTMRKLMRGAKPSCPPDTSFLPPGLGLSGVRHPWFAAPGDVLPGDQERIADLAGTQVFRSGAPRGGSNWLRMPLLSQPVIEVCLRAPSWMWIGGGQNRALARDAFADVLPGDVLQRRSKGTFMNYFGAIYDRNKAGMRGFLMDGRLRSRELIDGAALDRYFATPLQARDTSFLRIFDLCMIENWVRRQG